MKKRKIKIAPSILSGDFGHLAEESRRVEESGAEYLHIDIMDGSFVPNLTLGPRAVAAINKATTMFLDVHLMVYHPYDFVEPFVAAGADLLTFHFEATEDISETIEYIRRCNIKVGLAFCPETSISLVDKHLDQVDQILLMTVHPGFGGQEFMPEVIEKINIVKEMCDKRKLQVDIEVDGGINFENVRSCVEAGANVIVSGTTLFETGNLTEAVQHMRSNAEGKK